MLKVGDIIEVMADKGEFTGMIVRGEVINVSPIVIRFFYNYVRHELTLSKDCKYKLLNNVG